MSVQEVQSVKDHSAGQDLCPGPVFGSSGSSRGNVLELELFLDEEQFIHLPSISVQYGKIQSVKRF